jgi:hypothetical protein
MERLGGVEREGVGRGRHIREKVAIVGGERGKHGERGKTKREG